MISAFAEITGGLFALFLFVHYRIRLSYKAEYRGIVVRTCDYRTNACLHLIGLLQGGINGVKALVEGRFKDAYIWFWYGTVKSMVNAQWSLWEEDSPAGKVRIKIAKKVDKFC